MKKKTEFKLKKVILNKKLHVELYKCQKIKVNLLKIENYIKSSVVHI